ncbi:hypothetical protein ANSO36C_46980 [Nostoc cf. commune SO-36]|uniref:Uncharacterized protein n=1 Tax=Nostoc cf. commune SO-36 TaxID=449208 RepID=A0ABN6Q9H9_NOSCO|nr:hypothetical protein [Nostoc commune]BDI18896.1 hypothetical protein ANSO36C_46980 [Nostoc cf. commune SO-36]
MSANEILGQYTPAQLNLPLFNSQANLSRASLSREKRDSEKLNIEDTSAIIASEPSLILAPFIFLIMGGIVFFHKLKLSDQTNKLNNLDGFPCQNCHFFSKNSYLKCAVNPSNVLTKTAIDCCDYQPLQNIQHFRQL